ncbi:serine/threonine-protein kinase AFC2-like isoform X1 [Gossypium australe]|uniref:Serine/threonine-protein kinase AFC2-like isoform X1 n=1 Tax=Gossypium australe TaxID=47621 RepID=A0A5B6UJ70_9ROSI|nr:serine/threonine-protein kinase AFC2-like isoform X1 [Gossypium australe]
MGSFLAVVCKYGTGLTIVTIFVLCLRSLDQAYTIFYAKTIIAHFPLILSVRLADNYWNV